MLPELYWFMVCNDFEYEIYYLIIHNKLQHVELVMLTGIFSTKKKTCTSGWDLVCYETKLMLYKYKI